MGTEPMLVDARWPPPDPEPAPRRIPWARFVWPALTVAFLVAGNFVAPVLVLVCVVGALYSAVESFLHLVPLTNGMRDHRQ